MKQGLVRALAFSPVSIVLAHLLMKLYDMRMRGQLAWIYTLAIILGRPMHRKAAYTVYSD